MRIKWTAIYPNPPEISRGKYYKYNIKNDVAYVYGDGLTISYTVEQLKDFFSLETGNWDDVFRVKTKVIDKVINKATE